MEKSINKTKLVQMYGWNLQFLVKRINTSAELLKKLTETRYYSNQRTFTPLQGEIIFKHFGNQGSV